jgi:hypothetical protein
MGPFDHRMEDKLRMKKQDMTKVLGFIQAFQGCHRYASVLDDAHPPCTRCSLGFCPAVVWGKIDCPSKDRSHSGHESYLGRYDCLYLPSGSRSDVSNTPSALSPRPRASA